MQLVGVPNNGPGIIRRIVDCLRVKAAKITAVLRQGAAQGDGRAR